MLKLRCILVVAFLVHSCGPASNSSILRENFHVKDLVVLLAGGFRSCETTNFSESYQPLAERLQDSGLTIRLIQSCYTQYGNLYYQSPNMTARRSATSVEDVANAARSQLNASSSKLLVSIGHSYGGWLSLEVAESLRYTNYSQFIATMDVISPKHCGITTMSRTIVERASGLGSGDPGCQGPPKDWPRSRSQILMRHVQEFHNYYQTRDDVIHSGAIAGAHNHVMYFGSESSGWGTAHRAIDNDQRVWDGISDAVLSYLQSMD